VQEEISNEEWNTNSHIKLNNPDVIVNLHHSNNGMEYIPYNLKFIPRPSYSFTGLEN
jgi:hypothetical protein